MLRSLLRRFKKRSNTKIEESRVVVCINCDYANSAKLTVEEYLKLHNEQNYCSSDFLIIEEKFWKICKISSAVPLF
ncbi:hypothetical protein [Parapoynx stagnalis nucleopolyhedrovirus]|uniref:Uncharacterized protein n=1 Tax=Parapoynx stagnalis nucleopolyhedrovirus TaxID=2993413 RepID=A0A9E7Y6X3_9ABAC|nr:hypothetical protein [Parapoynx stagnalis nucleopolyhedrovirus]